MNFSWLLKMLASVFSPFTSLLSNEIKSELETFVTTFYGKALATENVWDDFFIKMLADILSVDISKVEAPGE